MNVALEIAKVVATPLAGEAGQKCVCQAIASKQEQDLTASASGGEYYWR